MAVAAGALTELTGVLAEHIGRQLSYLPPWTCYGFLLSYALSGYRATEALMEDRLAA